MNPDRTAATTVERITVREFTTRMKRLIERQATLQRIEIVGEVSGWLAHTNGYVYFDLKGDGALLKCVVFPRYVDGLTAAKNGDQIVAAGRVAVWEADSRYQLAVERVELLGVGAIAAKVEALRRRLQAEGLFELARKRAVARLPHRVALISARGQGANDFQSILRERAPNVAVLFVETRVQGEGAEIDIADALDRASHTDVDAIVLLRGGGSYEERYPFNTEPVARAIFRARHPVITAIGHAGDRHVADEVADAVYKTPTDVASYIAQSWLEVGTFLSNSAQRLDRRMEELLARVWQRFDASAGSLRRTVDLMLAHVQERLSQRDARLDRASPQGRLARYESRMAALRSALEAWPAPALAAAGARLARADERLAAAIDASLARCDERLWLLEANLAGNDPAKPLERGYAIVTREQRVLRDAREVSAGDRVAVRLFHGSLQALVEEVNDDD